MNNKKPEYLIVSVDCTRFDDAFARLARAKLRPKSPERLKETERLIVNSTSLWNEVTGTMTAMNQRLDEMVTAIETHLGDE